MSTAAIRTEIHKMVDRLDDSFLKIVHAMLNTYQEEQSISSKDNDEVDDGNESIKSDMIKAATPTRKNVSWEQLKKEQNYKPMTYEEWRAKADEIEWEESLEELLAVAK
ncbi:MAG: hypothetical protein AAF806_10335 [Bacteroidota bacterium]